MPRKKWKLVTQPSLAEFKFPSENKTYERVRDFRDAYANGRSDQYALTTYVDEGLGAGWETFERCDFRNGDWAVERAETKADDTNDAR